MSRSNDRKEAAKNLGIILQAQYRALLEAQGDVAVQDAAIILGDTFNRNIEFITWIMKEYGGVQQMPFQPVKPALPKLPPILSD